MAFAVILMGVSGSGKTSVGEELSNTLSVPFYDGDDYHPQANIEKMAQGIPLTDDDRQPWLEQLHQIIVEHVESNQSLIVACSALKASYREVLRGDIGDVIFVYLKGSYNLLHSRIEDRRGHYMKAEMLQSQFSDLEEPEKAFTISVNKPVSEITSEIADYVKVIGKI